jgi:tetratricopeptide (TPR) repeat protein
MEALAADSTPAAFDAANRLYEEAKFSEAAAAYERLLQGGAVSEALYFNWGNAQFKAGHIGRAIAAYRQAEDLAPRDPDLRANLKFAREQVQGPTLRPGWRERLLGTLSLNEGSLLAAVALWFWLLLLVARQVKPSLRPPLRHLTLATALLTMLLGATLGLNLRARLSDQTAIVIANDVAVRNGPFEESPTAFTVRDGAELRVLDRKDDWLQVSADARRVGWTARRNVLVMPAR